MPASVLSSLLDLTLQGALVISVAGGTETEGQDSGKTALWLYSGAVM